MVPLIKYTNIIILYSSDTILFWMLAVKVYLYKKIIRSKTVRFNTTLILTEAVIEYFSVENYKIKMLIF